MNRPVIGITLNFLPLPKKGPTHYISEKYTRAIIDAGGLPLLLPSTSGMVEIAGQALEMVDGLLLTGGGDLEPSLFNGKKHRSVYGISPNRDAFEIQAIQITLAKGLPLLGICRGCQTLNVALGGSLYTHIAEQKEGALVHDQDEKEERDRLSHLIKIEKGTHLADIFRRDNLQVNSLHHQGIDRVGKRLLVAALAEDGLVEAIEILDHPFGVAVQWHPEWLQGDANQRRLFEKFIDAANNYSQRRKIGELR